MLFITNTEWVYCAVRSEYLYVLQKINSFGTLNNKQAFLQQEQMSVYF